jgi:solute carrier family 36 (proton-coupled amino acid transporter)
MATVFLAIVCGIAFYFVFKDGITFKNTVPYTDIRKLPLFIRYLQSNGSSLWLSPSIVLCSTVIFAMEGIGVVMPIENKMAKPEHFLGCPGVLNIAMFVVVAMYASLGFFGYAKYGESAMGSITLNLDDSNM